MAADAELRRRHPGLRLDPLRSAEPEPITDSQASELTLTPGQPIPPAGEWITQLTTARRVFAEHLAERRGPQRDPSAEPGLGVPCQILLTGDGAETAALLQPPKPQIPPSRRVIERAAEMEAAN